MKYVFFLILCIFPIEAVAAPYIYPEPVDPNWECLPDTKIVRKITDDFKYSKEAYGEKGIGKIYQIDLNGDGECEYFVKGWGGRRRASESRVIYDSNGREIADIEGNEGSFTYGEKKNGYVRILIQTWGGGHTNIIYTTNVYSFDNDKYVCEFCTDNSHGGYQDLAKKAYEQKDYKLAEIYYWNAYRMYSPGRLSDASNLAVAYIKQNKLTEAISVLNQHLARNDDAIIRGESTPCYSGNCKPTESQLKRIKSSAFFNRGVAREKLGLFKDALKDYKIAGSLRSSKAAIEAIERVAVLDSQKESQTVNVVQEKSSPKKTHDDKGDIVIKGRLYFDGKPLSDYTKADATFKIYNRDSRQWVRPSFEYDPETASFNLHVIAEGKYSCNAEVDANFVNPELYAGDFKGHASFSAWFKSPPPSLKIDVERIIHLVEPQDNGKPLVGWGGACSNKVQFKNPVRISWEPVVEEDVYYTYAVNRVECSPFAYKETVVGDTTNGTSVTLDLPPNRDGEIYRLTIDARKNGRKVGSLMTHGGNGYGWDYRFRAVK